LERLELKVLLEVLVLWGLPDLLVYLVLKVLLVLLDLKGSKVFKGLLDP
jgi:hypothetical protein